MRACVRACVHVCVCVCLGVCLPAPNGKVADENDDHVIDRDEFHKLVMDDQVRQWLSSMEFDVGAHERGRGHTLLPHCWRQGLCSA